MPNNLKLMRTDITDDERVAIEYAAKIKDRKFLRNSSIIRQEFLLYLADPYLKKAKVIQFAKARGIKPGTLWAMRKHPSFQLEFRSYIRNLLGGDKEIRRAYQELIKAMRRGESWAVKKILEDTGVMSHIDKSIKVVKSFDELYKDIQKEENNEKVIDTEFTEEKE